MKKQRKFESWLTVLWGILSAGVMFASLIVKDADPAIKAWIVLVIAWVQIRIVQEAISAWQVLKTPSDSSKLS